MRLRIYNYITTLAFVLSWLFAGAVAAQAPGNPPSIKPDAPDRYVVQKGDTLWSISQRYLDAPWHWPDLWRMNQDQVKNPNLIYPGNVLVLDRTRGQLALGTVKLSPSIRAESTRAQAIPSIPPSVIEPFLSRPLVVELDGLNNAPVIVATEERRVIVGAGNRVYASGLGGSTEDTWYIYHRGKALIDPETNQTLGYEAEHLGTARVTRPGDPATLQIVAASQEIAAGDKLIPAGPAQALEYAPHAPGNPVRGQIIAVHDLIDHIGEAGRQSVVTLNRGKADGLEPGHVLALSRQGALVNPKAYGTASAAGTSAGAGVMLPDERYGLVFVFRVFEHVSYALVMNVTRQVNQFDVVQNP
jgi:nucleoid-associated protein YgaU